MGTFMAWLKDVEAGGKESTKKRLILFIRGKKNYFAGGTAFVRPYFESTIMPERGSAAFWYDLDSKGHRNTDR